MGIKDSELFLTAAKRAYSELDADGSGCVDYKEVAIGLLKLYDVINARLPVHVMAPSRADMFALCRKFDADEDGCISEAEFIQLARMQFGTRESWRQSLTWHFASAIALNMVLFPLAASYIIWALREHGKMEFQLPQAPVAAAVAMLYAAAANRMLGPREGA